MCAEGAARLGGILSGEVRDLISLELTEYPIGLRDADGWFVSLFARNTSLPTARRLEIIGGQRPVFLQLCVALPDGAPIPFSGVTLTTTEPVRIEIDELRHLTVWQGDAALRTVSLPQAVPPPTHEALLRQWSGKSDPPAHSRARLPLR